MLRALRNAGVSVYGQDLNLRILWAHDLPRPWTTRQAEGLTDAELFSAATAERLAAAKHGVLAGGLPLRLEVDVADGSEVRWFDLWIDADRDEDERIQGIVTTAIDITEQKHREHTLKMLLREVSHRSKNLLAIIQSIATQTGRYSQSIESFLTGFRGRIQSLASSQDLVTSSNWRGAELSHLVYGQVSRYTLSPQKAIEFSGDATWLNPNAAMHVGLALHELAVNSVSFGALSRPNGHVSVRAEIVRERDEQALSFTWREQLDRAQQDAAGEKRFGSVALERIVPASLNGQAALKIAEGELTYMLLIPKGQFETL